MKGHILGITFHSENHKVLSAVSIAKIFTKALCFKMNTCIFSTFNGKLFSCLCWFGVIGDTGEWQVGLGWVEFINRQYD